jgi:demethylspheroidene O-methyltransferase
VGLGFQLNRTMNWPILRDRLLASPRFHRWVLAIPGLRSIARLQSRRLFDLVAGFSYSQVLLSCVELNVFEKLAAGPRRASELQRELDLNDRSFEVLTRAAVALELLEWRTAPAGEISAKPAADASSVGASRWLGLGMLGAVVAGNKAISAMVMHHKSVYQDLADPVALLRDPSKTTQLREYWAYTRESMGEPNQPNQSHQPSTSSPSNPSSPSNQPSAPKAAGTALTLQQVSDYSELMAASQPLVAEQVLAAYDFSKHRCLLDMGGGQGAFLSAVAKAHPQLRLMLFDLPAVVQKARSVLANDGLTGRMTFHGGSFFSDPVPTGADLISLVRVLYDHSDERVMTILKSARRALSAQGGWLLLAEPMSGTPGAEAMGDAYFGLYLLAMGKGRARTPQELARLLTQAGFTRVEAIPTRLPLQTGLMRAYAPAG